MQIKIKEHSTHLLVALVTFAVGVAVTLLWVVPYFRTASTPGALKVADTPKDEGTPLPGGWKQLKVKNKVTIRLPQDMETSELIGDSFAYREAYSNQDLNITIVYGEMFPPDIFPQRRSRRGTSFDPCETVHLLLERPNYHESVIDIDGRKAKLGIDRSYQDRYIIAHLCFLKSEENATPLSIIAYCRDDRALETAQQIFTSIKFKDN